jgi:hypothetical protein
MKALILLIATGLAACTAQPPPQARIASACEPGQRGCVGAYAPYESPAEPAPETSEPGMIGLRQGQMVVCH